jgi:hypothetical protein
MSPPVLFYLGFGYHSLQTSGGGGGYFPSFISILSAIALASIGGEERQLDPLFIILLSVQH